MSIPGCQQGPGLAPYRPSARSFPAFIKLTAFAAGLKGEAAGHPRGLRRPATSKASLQRKAPSKWSDRTRPAQHVGQPAAATEPEGLGPAWAPDGSEGLGSPSCCCCFLLLSSLPLLVHHRLLLDLYSLLQCYFSSQPTPSSFSSYLSTSISSSAVIS